MSQTTEHDTPTEYEPDEGSTLQMAPDRWLNFLEWVSGGSTDPDESEEAA